MFNRLISQLLDLGGDLDQSVRVAQNLAREAFKQVACLSSQIDESFGNWDFREGVVEPIIAKERQVEALRHRLARGGKGRNDDRSNLEALLNRRVREFEALNDLAPWDELAPEHRQKVEEYIEARRRMLYLGDADKVRSALIDEFTQVALAS